MEQDMHWRVSGVPLCRSAATEQAPGPPITCKGMRIRMHGRMCKQVRAYISCVIRRK